MDPKNETITINGKEYIAKDSSQQNELDGQYVIVRGDRSSSFAGLLISQKGQQVELAHARRIWYWSGAASLSQLAVDGTSKPDDCKFPAAVIRVTILDAVEIIYCTNKAKKSIQAVKIWKE